MTIVKVFFKSVDHENERDVQASSTFDCDCGQTITITGNLSEHVCSCGKKYRINCMVQYEIEEDIDYVHRVKVCPKCTVPVLQCPDPNNPKEYNWISGTLIF